MRNRERERVEELAQAYRFLFDFSIFRHSITYKLLLPFESPQQREQQQKHEKKCFARLNGAKISKSDKIYIHV
jgi:hypothetical protein